MVSLSQENSAPIGVFDSGLGGLTVAKEIASALPHEQIIYLGDTARCPYGPKDPADVRTYVLEICSFFEKKGVKLIIIACNTATAAGLAIAQQVFSIPVIGVVEPGARAAVKATHNRKVGVIGTAGTIQSGIYSNAVRALDAGVTTYSVATPLFVDIVEEGLLFDSQSNPHVEGETSDVYIKPQFYEIARDYLKPLRSSGIDTLVLGCTHFPLLSTAIGQVMGKDVKLISSADETASEVRSTLNRRGDARTMGFPQHQFFTTGSVEEFRKLGSRVFGREITDVQHISVEELETYKPQGFVG